MRLPNKVITYKESILPKFPVILKIVRDADITPNNLYKRVKPSYLICFDEIDEFSLHTSKDMQLPIILIHIFLFDIYYLI